MKNHLSIREITFIAMATALMAIFSQISIPLPFTAVPITMQVFGVVVIAIVLEEKISAVAMLIFILLGAIGIPVFSNLSGGISVLVGPTGGYIWGFILMAFIIGYAAARKNKELLFLATYISLIIDYLFGVFQLKIVLGLSMEKALMVGAYPFIVKDIIVVALAVVIALMVKKNLGSILKIVKAQ